MTIKVTRVDADHFADWQGLLDIILGAFSYMDGRIDPPSSAHRLTLESLKEKARGDITYIATENDTLLGCIFCKPEPETLYIGKLAIAPEAQGKGVGRMLLAAATVLARELQKPVIRLETRIELVENHAIFSRWGFIKTREYAHAGYDHPTSIEMRKSV